MIDEKNRIHKILAEELSAKILLRAIQSGHSLDSIETASFCQRLVKCIGSSVYNVDVINIPVIIILDPEILASSASNLTESDFFEIVSKKISSSSNVFRFNTSGKFTKQEDNYVEDIAEASSLSDTQNDILFFIKGKAIDTIINGRTVHHIENASAYKKPGFFDGTEVHIEDWENLLLRYYEQELKEQKGVHYWGNKADYLLVDSPEKIFRKHLAYYLTKNTIGCIVDEEAYVGNGDNRTDIRVITDYDHQVYYFELKCMGKCLSATLYGEDHANSGLRQVNEYAISDNRCVTGVLIVYDGRKKKAAIKWLPEILKVLNSNVKPSHIYSLDPTSASAIGKLAVAATKKPIGKKSPKRSKR